ncbi:hypothetical protein QQG21_11245 [Staphylococcus aureus]|nr:hypothetical protein QQG23_10440 [Staphylococcus aureus]WKD07677.1 hypothetical protein QQG21_11245 [Staphylococcus aureus]
MMTTDKPKDADILERVKDILNKKRKKKIIMARSCKLLRGASFNLCNILQKSVIQNLY